jgi:hypothetical protein
VTPSPPKNLSDIFQANDVPAMSDNVETAPDTIAAEFPAMVDEGCSTGAGAASHARSLAERVTPQSRDWTILIFNGLGMMRFGFRRVTAVTTDGAPMFSAPPRRAPWIHGARRFVLAFRSL